VILGARRTIVLSAVFDVAAFACVLLVAGTEDRIGVVGPVVAPILVVMVVGYARAARRQDELVAPGRHERIGSMLVPGIARFGSQAAMIAVFSVPVAIVMAVLCAFVLVYLIPAYQRRIAGGELRAALERATARRP
jgi:hypothetical protein